MLTFSTDYQELSDLSGFFFFCNKNRLQEYTTNYDLYITDGHVMVNHLMC